MNPASPHRRSITTLLIRATLPLAAIIVSTAYLVVLSAALATPMNATPDTTLTATPRPLPKEAAPIPVKPSPASPSPTAKPTPKADYPTVFGLPEGQECSRSGTGPWAAVAVNSTTSCAFALNVQQAYDLSGLNGSSGTIRAYSPTTRLDYVLTCQGNQPAVCTGGRNAEIQIFGGPYVPYTSE